MSIVRTALLRASNARHSRSLALVNRVRARAASEGVPSDAGAEHMLYGIRAREQHALAERGLPVRVLISYGTHWFPWYVRRLAERPANVWFLVRSLVS